MKIAVITMHAIKNYGSALQTYATQRILEEMGADVEIINYIRKKNLDSNLSETWTRSDRGAKKAIKKWFCILQYTDGRKCFGII